MLTRLPLALAAALTALLLGHGTAASAAAPDAGVAVVALAEQQLGAVLDTRNAGDGALVRAVTPGGAAERLGLSVGDRIVSVNGRPLGDGDIERLLASAKGQVELSVLRDGRERRVSGVLDAGTREPAKRGCGYVTTLGTTPRSKESVFSALITMIDGESTPLTPVNRHELAAGRHVLIVDERIDPQRFNNTQRLQRQLMRRELRARAYKAIVVDIEPDRTYRIGARLHRDRLDRDGIRGNTFWEPVVWSSFASRCR